MEGLMKTIAIMQPYIFPYIGYFQLIGAVDVFVSCDDVQYIKGGWINRNRILLNGLPKYITFPVKKGPRNFLINERFLADDIITNEKKRILASLRHSYSKAPFFSVIYLLLEDIINIDERNVSRFAEHTQTEILKYLDINVEYKRSSELDFDKFLKLQDRVIEIVKKLDGKCYINPIGGLELYSSEEFAKNGIELRFLKSEVKPYQQFSDDFVPNLSIIDVLMFNSKEDVRLMLKQFSLITKGNVD